MYTVVLVDDDALVLEFMKQMIDWDMHGFMIAGSFQDSIDALGWLQNHYADVLITDIGMPRLNGIELISRLKEVRKEMMNVILSCHDEFHYAQQALKLGTFDYLLKETMEKESIEELIGRLREELDQQKQTAVQTIKWNSLEKQTILQEESNWLFQSEHLKDAMAELGLLKDGKLHNAALFFMDEENKYHSELETAVDMKEILCHVWSGQGVTVHVYPFKEAFLVFFLQDREGAVPVEHFWKKSQQALSMSTSILHSNAEVPADEFAQEVQQLLDNRQQRFYLNKGAICLLNHSPFSSEHIFTQYGDDLREAEMWILQEEEIKLKKWLEMKINHIRCLKYEPSTVRNWGEKLVLDLQMKFNALCDFEKLFCMPAVDNYLRHSGTIHRLEHSLLQELMQLMNYSKEITGLPQNREIIKAQKYVMFNIDKKISLNDMAEHLHLNPSYFSRFYKQQTGETFINYVTKLKMTRAKELLDNTNKTVDDISDLLGYENKSYFYKTFRKYYGLPPKEYRHRVFGKQES